LVTGNKPRDNLLGFTLIELVFVVVIISVLALALGLNLKNSLGNFQLNEAAWRLQVFMQYLRNRSIVELRSIRLVFENDLNRYWAGYCEDESNQPIKIYSFPKGLKFKVEKNNTTIDNSQVIFYPDGKIDKVTISITSDTAGRQILTTEGVFGGVRLVKEQR